MPSVTHSQWGNVPTRVTHYDRVSSLLVALNLLMALLVLVLFSIWGSAPAQPTTRYLPIPIPAGGQNPTEVQPSPSAGGGDALESDPSASLKAALAVIGQAAATVQQTTRGSAPGTIGPDERVAPSPTPNPTRSEPQRWKIEYAAESRGEYAHQLAKLGIQLGVVSLETLQIVLVSPAGKIIETVDRDRMSSRLRFSHPGGPMATWDRQTCEQAGISLFDAAVVQFYPDSLRSQMRELEAARAAADGQSVESIHRTRFALVADAPGNGLEIVEIRYRGK